MKIKYISWIPAVIMMIIIFSFSSKPAVDSNESSLSVVHEIIHIYDDITKTQFPADMVEILNHMVRKSAHFCEYALFAVTIALHTAALRKKRKWLFFLPVIVSFLYACTDEYHQTFVPGRAGMIQDALLDTSGAAAGSLLFLLIFLIITGKKNKRKAKLILKE